MPRRRRPPGCRGRRQAGGGAAAACPGGGRDAPRAGPALRAGHHVDGRSRGESRGRRRPVRPGPGRGLPLPSCSGAVSRCLRNEEPAIGHHRRRRHPRARLERRSIAGRDALTPRLGSVQAGTGCICVCVWARGSAKSAERVVLPPRGRRGSDTARRLRKSVARRPWLQ
eukprot:scaffold872_cov421-Prasinococcus_capsulatus_cf.AAC.20